ncbi:DUF397 domain-containing protein [Kitasatospora sp. NPDC092948]|uniref:DUF397 domain-containing protein n=1 Tax=Kitasatospora sp. NPDC092948 TaxID=3364088 RepID=UPI0037F6689E
MGEYTNGMAADLIEAKTPWVKARRSSNVGQCVEMRKMDDGRVAVRHSLDPSGPALIFSVQEIAAYLDGARNGEFDHMAV